MKKYTFALRRVTLAKELVNSYSPYGFASLSLFLIDNSTPDFILLRSPENFQLQLDRKPEHPIPEPRHIHQYLTNRSLESSLDLTLAAPIHRTLLTPHH
jgi:hypothetical protein